MVKTSFKVAARTGFVKGLVKNCKHVIIKQAY
jgi:hypothetical protein